LTHWLQSADAALFRFLNQSLSNPLFDWLMPVLSGNKLFVPTVLVAAVVLIWKQRTKGTLCVAFILLAVALGDPLIINSIKHAIARPRPFVTMPETLTLVGKTASYSLPSAHAANMAAAAMVAFLFFRRSWRFMVPLAAAVAFSRVYNGVHYVSDVLIGATLGAGYAAVMVWALDRTWQWAGQKWFPLWWKELPALCDFGSSPSSPSYSTPPQPDASFQLSTFSFQLSQHWLRLGYIVIAVLFLARLAYIGGSTIELSEDEAYQWQWSKHPALAYYSKPPGIAVAQWIGTHLWGDTAFGVRFLAPCVTALMSLLLLRFFAREATAKLGLFVVLAATATPLLSVGAVLMTVDCLSVLFWTLAMLSGWQAVRSTDAHVRANESRTWASALRPWLWTGLWLALGFLSKNTNAFQLLCFALFFVLWKPARAQLRTAGPWLALGLVALALLPQLLWNAQHGWATVEHLHNRAGLAQAWKFTPNYLIDFLAAELVLLNPAFLALILGGVLATLAQLRGGDLQSPSGGASSESGSEGQVRRSESHPTDQGTKLRPNRWKYTVRMEGARPASSLSGTADGDCKSPARASALPVFLLCMGLPLLLGYFLYTLRARVQPNWIVPAVLPLLCLAALQADACWRRGIRSVRVWFLAGLALGLPLVILLHDTNLTGKIFGTPLPPKLDPLNRVRGWKALAETVEVERQKVIAAEGKPVFLIGAHYGLTSLLSFYIPEAKVGAPHAPLVFYQSSAKPENQYGFWPGYNARLGATALYVQQLKKGAQPEPPPARLAAEFTRIEDLGTREIQYRGRPIHTVRLLLCRELRELPANHANAGE
jgi:membrane-associated phospholipid phosphatase/4-amino-4-deoxy-L-arabinose transferase-like glycosyltransferase